MHTPKTEGLGFLDTREKGKQGVETIEWDG